MAISASDRDPQYTMDTAALDRAVEEDVRAGASAPSRRPGAVVVAAVVLLAGAVVYYFFWMRTPAPAPKIAEEPAAVAPTLLAQAPVEPAILHPIESIPGAAQAQLPKLDQSDALVRESIAGALNGNAGMQLLAPGAIVRLIVATVDNLPRETVALRIRPVKPVPGAFETAIGANGTLIAPDNDKRYAPYVSAAEAIDTARLVGFYVRLYPLFQQAYTELGYPKGYFNDRLVVVIDHLLATPEPATPIELVQPKVMYQFADPALEERSAGQKILMRTGLDNELRLKAKLREIRKALVADAPKP
ncbi:MAG: DUF3014 domain-containing protein [Betaproteobacteria bacterium]